MDQEETESADPIFARDHTLEWTKLLVCLRYLSA